MSTNTETWGNIELPGLSDEKLFKTQWNYVAANREKANNKEFLKKLSAGVKQSYVANPDQKKAKVERLKKVNKELYSDPEYRQSIKQKRQQQANDPTYKEKLALGIAKRDSNPDYIKARKLARIKPLITDFGIFESRNDAAKAQNCDPAYINSLMKKYPDRYFYISQEEYIMLTGKDI